MKEAKGPRKKIVVGGVSASIWDKEAQTKSGESFVKAQVVLDKVYRGYDGDFRSTYRLDAGDLPKAVIALSRAYEEIVGVRLMGIETRQEPV